MTHLPADLSPYSSRSRWALSVEFGAEPLLVALGLPNLFYLENRAREAGVQTHGLSLVPKPLRLWKPSGLK